MEVGRNILRDGCIDIRMGWLRLHIWRLVGWIHGFAYDGCYLQRWLKIHEILSSSMSIFRILLHLTSTGLFASSG
jgi:hypothetical protein